MPRRLSRHFTRLLPRRLSIQNFVQSGYAGLKEGNKDEKIRWGVLSVSGHYKLRIHGQVGDSRLNEVVGIASRDAGKARLAAQRLGIPKSFGSYEALLEDPDIDAVYIPLPNHLHAPWIKKSAAAGKHVLCEKPFAMSAREAALRLPRMGSRTWRYWMLFSFRKRQVAG